MKSILNENEKQKLLENFQVSGKTQAAFAVENGINPKTLARWIVSVKPSGEKSDFLCYNYAVDYLNQQKFSGREGFKNV